MLNRRRYLSSIDNGGSLKFPLTIELTYENSETYIYYGDNLTIELYNYFYNKLKEYYGEDYPNYLDLSTDEQLYIKYGTNIHQITQIYLYDWSRTTIILLPVPNSWQIVIYDNGSIYMRKF